MRLPLLALASLGLLSMLPLVAADDDPRPLIPCDDTPGEIVQAVLDYPEWFVNALLFRTEEVGGKLKCTVLETAGICSNESLPFTPGFPSTTGEAHPHRRVCYEYMILSNQCAKTDKLRHYQHANGQHSEACVPVYCGFIVEPPYRNELRVGSVTVYRPCPPLPSE